MTALGLWYKTANMKSKFMSKMNLPRYEWTSDVARIYIQTLCSPIFELPKMPTSSYYSL